jgi:hypothetical protein
MAAPVHNNQNIMVDFSCIFDTALGSALYLRLCSTNFSYYHDFLKKSSLDYFKYMALNRKEENPIAYLFKDEYAGHADTIYGELKVDKWEKVLSYSPPTEIAHVMYLGAKEGKYKITINCENELEANRVKDFTNLWKTEINIENVSKYDVLYIYDIEDIIRRKWDIDKKVVYLYDWSKNHVGFKMDPEAGINPLALRWVDKAIFNFIYPYKEKQPVG